MKSKNLEIELETRATGRIRSSDRERTRMGGARHWLVSLAQLGLLLAIVPAATKAGEPTVILLSWDGTRHDYPDRGSFPALERMQREGLRADRLVPVFPANTFPNHVTLATGAHPGVHGIVGNSFEDVERGRFHYDSDASWLEAEPIWIAAERQGVRAAVFFWVGSETDWEGSGASYRKAPFKRRISEASKVEQILAWLDLPEPERPRLILSWWHGADSAGHRWGPDDPRVAAQVAAQDRQLLRLLAGLDDRDAWARTTLIVTSDHGMAHGDRSIDVSGILEEAGLRSRMIAGGGMAYLWLDDPSRLDEALAILGGLDHVRVYASERLPAEYGGHHARRSGHLVVLTDPPYRFFKPKLRQRLSGLPGTHGYAPEHPDMAAIFYALGRGVPRGARPARVRAIDVAATIARLLGIDPPHSSVGTPIPEILPPSPHPH